MKSLITITLIALLASAFIPHPSSLALAMPLIPQDTTVSLPFEIVRLNFDVIAKAPAKVIFTDQQRFDPAATLEPVVFRWRTSDSLVGHFDLSPMLAMTMIDRAPCVGVAVGCDLLNIAALYNPNSEALDLGFKSQKGMEMIVRFLRWSANVAGIQKE
jgi:hypothetical protein